MLWCVEFALGLALWEYFEIRGKGASHDIFLPTFHCQTSEVGIFLQHFLPGSGEFGFVLSR